jgi:hypothetical protein
MQAYMRHDQSSLGFQMAHYSMMPTEKHFATSGSYIFKNTWSPALNSLWVLPLTTQLFFLSWATFKFCLIFTIFSSISLSRSGPTTAWSIGLFQVTGVLHFLPQSASNGIIFRYV